MPTTIAVEARPIFLFGVDTGFDHLYLVKTITDAAGTVIDERVIGGGPGGDGTLVTYANLDLALSQDARGSETLAERHHTVLDFGGRDPEAVWGLMVQHAVNIDSANLVYGIEVNSNTVAASALHTVGIDLGLYLPVSPWEVPLYDRVGAVRVNNVLVGGGQPDVILGGVGDDWVFGGGANDILYGEAGHDVLVGGDGIDLLVGGDGSDYLYMASGGGSAYGEAGIDVGVGSPAADVFVMGAGADTAYGYDGNDYFYMGPEDDTAFGGAGADVLIGEDGNDYLDGGSGVDYYWGGAGRDTFVVRAGETGSSVVEDFVQGQDLLVLYGSGFTSLEDLKAHTTNYGSFSIITLNAEANIWMMGLLSTQFTVADFAIMA